jgi:hypothetical protein
MQASFDLVRASLRALPMTAEGARLAVGVVRAAEESHAVAVTDSALTSEWVALFTTEYDALQAFLQKPTYDGGVWFKSLAEAAIHRAWEDLADKLLQRLWSHCNITTLRPSPSPSPRPSPSPSPGPGLGLGQ